MASGRPQNVGASGVGQTRVSGGWGAQHVPLPPTPLTRAFCGFFSWGCGPDLDLATWEWPPNA